MDIALKNAFEYLGDHDESTIAEPCGSFPEQDESTTTTAADINNNNNNRNNEVDDDDNMTPLQSLMRTA